METGPENTYRKSDLTGEIQQRIRVLQVRFFPTHTVIYTHQV